MSLWPGTLKVSETLVAQLKQAKPADGQLPPTWLSQWDDLWCPVAAWLAEKVTASQTPLILGVHGGQGSGKSTLSNALKGIYKETFDWNVVVISIDDLYLSHAERAALGETTHPLLRTRGVPGTHDAHLGIRLFQQLKALKSGETVKFPAFDKASDDRLPPSDWHTVSGPVDLIIFEGWCVGCTPVSAEALSTPLNTLEATEDSDGRWREWVNRQLATLYRDWFDLIDELIMLKVPDMDAVLRWRSQQETENRANAQGTTDRSFSDQALVRFIQHYERLTRQALDSLPANASLVLNINQSHEVDAVTCGGRSQ